MALPERFLYLRQGEQVAAALQHYLSFGMPLPTHSDSCTVMDLKNGLFFRATVMPSGAHLYEVVTTPLENT